MRNNIMESQYTDLIKIMELLKQLVDSYRLLVGSASDLNSINKRRTRDVEKALDRVNIVGDLIDDLLELIEEHQCNYIKISSIKNKVIGLKNEKNKVKKEFEHVIETEVNEELNFHNKKRNEEIDEENL